MVTVYDCLGYRLQRTHTDKHTQFVLPVDIEVYSISQWKDQAGSVVMQKILTLIVVPDEQTHHKGTRITDLEHLHGHWRH